MPGYLIPRKSGVHRVACFALFRALLRQVNQLPLAAVQQKTVGDQIRAVIRRNTKLQSPDQVSTALDLGYETLEALSQGAWNSILMRILELGAQRTAAHRQIDNGYQAQIKAKEEPKFGPNGAHQRVWPYPNTGMTLDRPFATLSGRRRVPKLVNANRVPLLRLKKPQSPFVSRIIRDTIDTRERRITLANQLDEQLQLARDEDEWDAIILDQFWLEEDHSLSHEPWSHEIRLAIRENSSLQAAAIQKRAELAARMHSIVQQEEALALEEELKIRDEKHKRRKAKRLARRAQEMPVAEEAMTLDSSRSTSAEAKSIQKDPEEPKHKEIVLEDTVPEGAVPEGNVPELVVRDKERFQTKEEIARIRAGNAVSRTEEEIAEIKAARVRRKEEAARHKAEKVKRKAESVRYWQEKLGSQSNHTTSAPDWLSPHDVPSRKRLSAVVLQDVRSESSKGPVLQRRPRKSDLRGWDSPENSTHKNQANIQ